MTKTTKNCAWNYIQTNTGFKIISLLLSKSATYNDICNYIGNNCNVSKYMTAFEMTGIIILDRDKTLSVFKNNADNNPNVVMKRRQLIKYHNESNRKLKVGERFRIKTGHYFMATKNTSILRDIRDMIDDKIRLLKVQQNIIQNNINSIDKSLKEKSL